MPPLAGRCASLGVYLPHPPQGVSRAEKAFSTSLQELNGDFLASLIDHGQLWRGSGSMDEMPISGLITRASEPLGQGEELGICILIYASGDYAALRGADLQKQY